MPTQTRSKTKTDRQDPIKGKARKRQSGREEAVNTSITSNKAKRKKGKSTAKTEIFITSYFPTTKSGKASPALEKNDTPVQARKRGYSEAPDLESPKRLRTEGGSPTEKLWDTFQLEHSADITRAQFITLGMCLHVLHFEGNLVPVDAFDAFIADYSKFRDAQDRIAREQLCQQHEYKIPAYHTWFLAEAWHGVDELKQKGKGRQVVSSSDLQEMVKEHASTYLTTYESMKAIAMLKDSCSLGP